MNHLSTIVPPDGMNAIGDETMLKHADFVVNQVYSYEDAGDDDEPALIASPCMKVYSIYYSIVVTFIPTSFHNSLSSGHHQAGRHQADGEEKVGREEKRAEEATDFHDGHDNQARQGRLRGDICGTNCGGELLDSDVLKLLIR